jgi:colanic acid/amylovoran biosynthesis glycosyltransferase
MAIRKMRIGLVLSSVPPYSETFFTTKINGLTQSGFAVSLFAQGKRNPELRCAWVKPYPQFTSSLARMVMASVVLPFVFARVPGRVVRFWKRERRVATSRVDIAKKLYLNAHILPHALDWLHFGFAAVAIGREELAYAIGARMAVSFRGYDLNVHPLKHPGCYKKLWERVDRVHSISRYLMQKSVALGLSRDKPFQIITPALAIDLQLKVKRDVELHQPVRILTVARLTWIKGLEFGIRAVGILKSMKIPVHYTIIGGGPDYEKLLYEINDLGLAAEVELTGRLSQTETLRIMAQSDIYIQPSLNEGFCNSLLEAQAVGCLCIASDAGALPENILQNETGWLVPSRNPEKLAEVIQRVISMPLPERLQIKGNAGRRIIRDFSIESHRQQWVNFYTQTTPI